MSIRSGKHWCPVLMMYIDGSCCGRQRTRLCFVCLIQVSLNSETILGLSVLDNFDQFVFRNWRGGWQRGRSISTIDYLNFDWRLLLDFDVDGRVLFECWGFFLIQLLYFGRTRGVLFFIVRRRRLLGFFLFWFSSRRKERLLEKKIYFPMICLVLYTVKDRTEDLL